MAKKSTKKTAKRNLQNIRAKKRALIKARAVTGSVKAACAAAKLDRTRHYEWIKSDPEYKEAFEQAEREAADELEEEAFRRATEGVRKYKFHNGEPIIDPRTKRPYYELNYSDTLLIFLLKAAKPEKYREYTHHTGNVEHKHDHSGTVRVIEDSDWYDNADRLPAKASGSSGADSTASGTVQSRSVRSKIRKNGNGAARSTKRARSNKRKSKGSN